MLAGLEAGIHGQTAAATKKYAADGSTNGPWSSNSANKIDWARGEPITFYSGNYLNWRSSSTITRTRLEIMQEVLTTLLADLVRDVTLGLRLLVRSPWFSALSIATLALGNERVDLRLHLSDTVTAGGGDCSHEPISRLRVDLLSLLQLPDL